MKRIMLIVLIFLLLSSTAFAGHLTFGWEYPKAALVSDHVVAFWLYKSNIAGQYDVEQPWARIPVGSDHHQEGPTYVFDRELEITAPEGTRTSYYFIIRAVDSDGFTSSRSNEVHWLADTRNPPLGGKETFKFRVTVTTDPEVE